MGRVLTIRLSAVTFDESEVFRAWPRLCDLAWPGRGEVEDGEWKPLMPLSTVGAFPEADKVPCGVLDLAAALADQARFGYWPPERKKLLCNGLSRLEQARTDLERALGDWKPSDAHQASNAVEDTLDDMEKLLR